MDTDYRYAGRQAILDYILLDEAEQGRLGLPMPKKVKLLLPDFMENLMTKGITGNGKECYLFDKISCCNSQMFKS